MSINILSCNVRGLANMNKHQKMFRFLREKNPDIVFMQETHSKKSDQNLWRSQWGANIIFDNDSSKAKGVCICFSKRFDYVLKKIERSHEGRFLLVTIEHNGKTFLLCNIYAPNSNDPTFFAQIFKRINDNETDFVIIGGDLNVILDPKLDKKSMKTTSEPKMSEAAKLINTSLEENNWCNIWRLMHPDQTYFTWSRRADMTMSRLDYFLIPQAMVGIIKECKIIPSILTDHSFISIEI